MKRKRSFDPHLLIREVALPPGGELAPQSPGWSFFHVSRGVGYWLHSRGNHELATGSALLFSERTPGLIRASQVGEVLIHFFRLQPERLTGLMTLSEQQFLASTCTSEQLAVRIFRPGEPVAENFRKRDRCGKALAHLLR